MNFKQYKLLKYNLLKNVCNKELTKQDVKPAPLVLAYLGDAIFSFYVRQRLVQVERNKVHVLNDVSASVVSAVMQAKALEGIMDFLTVEEINTVRRGRNTKSAVPKSASVHEYRNSTGFECLLGWLLWQKDEDRLYFIMDKSFEVINNYLLKQENGDYNL